MQKYQDVKTSRAVVTLSSLLCCSAFAAVPAEAQVLGALTQVSTASPFNGSTADSGQSGTNYANTEVEPWVMVNPANRNNITAIWQQDRWDGGGCRGEVCGVTFDGGLTWKEVVLPGITLTSGGTLQRASDPWVSYGPTGTLFAASLALNSNDAPNGVTVSRSTDGGLTWGAPIFVISDPAGNNFNDKESVTADPTDANFAYTVWDRSDASNNQPAYLSRTTDGGITWSPAVRIGGSQQTVGNQIIVRPDGTLLDFFTWFDTPGTDPTAIGMIYSLDKGVTWLPSGNPIKVADFTSVTVNTPDTNTLMRTAEDLAEFAVDPANGNLYTVWQDARLSGNVYNDILFSASTDSGITWSAPVKINKTPAATNKKNQQAWNPVIRVTADGTIGVAYYDFRNNTTSALADYWLVQCKPTPSNPPTVSASWGKEVRLTSVSFDFKTPPYARGYFLGDYGGLATAGNDFLNIFSQPSGTDKASVFFRRVAPTASANVTANVTLEGSKNPAQTVAFQFRPTDGTAPFTYTETLTATGTPSVGTAAIPGVPPGTYTVHTKGAIWLAANTALAVSSGGAILSPALPAGDADNNNKVNFDDFLILLNAFGSFNNLSGSGYDPNADFDNNGSVNFDDFLLLLGNFGANGDN